MFFRLLFKPRNIKPAATSGIQLRRLGPADAAIFCAHLHALHYQDFRDRFNGLVSDEWLDRYIARSLDNATVIGAFNHGKLVAVAELHTGGRLMPGTGEAAFSVASDLRRMGLGTMLLIALLNAAAESGVDTVIVETGPQNLAMKKLARKFGAKMKFAGDQSVGHIDVAEGLRLSAKFRQEMPAALDAPHPADLRLGAGAAT